MVAANDWLRPGDEDGDAAVGIAPERPVVGAGDRRDWFARSVRTPGAGAGPNQRSS
jgi:hypothetical protein